MKKITLRLTDEASMAITASAEKAGLSMNAYIVASAASRVDDDKLVSRVATQISVANEEQKALMVEFMAHQQQQFEQFAQALSTSLSDGLSRELDAHTQTLRDGLAKFASWAEKRWPNGQK